MKNKKVLIPIILAIALISVIAIVFMFNNKSIQETRELNDVAQKVQKYIPDTPVEEIKDALNKPVSDEEKQAFDELYIDPSTLDDVKTTPPEEFILPDEIPDNLELRVDDNGNFYYLELYPEEFNSLEEYAEYLAKEAEKIEASIANEATTTNTEINQPSQENINQNTEDIDMGIIDDTDKPTSLRGFTTDPGPAGTDFSGSYDAETHADYSGLRVVAG